VKPPFDDRTAKALCRRCLPAELRRIKKELAALNKMLLTSPEKKNTYSVSAI
jgi:hypothetical protein